MTSNIENKFEGKLDVDELQVKIEYLQTKLEDAIKRIRGNRKNNQTKASFIKVSVIFLSGAATVLLGLQVSGLQAQLKDVAFVLTALVTVLTIDLLGNKNRIGTSGIFPSSLNL